MIPVGILPLLLTLSLLSQTTRAIERAFFQNDADSLSSLLSSKGHVNVSLPEPISFSDQLSSEQAFFLFRRIYSTFITFEFYPDSDPFVFPKDRSFIFKARWSFKNKKNNNQYVLQVFFYLVRELESSKNVWRIAEIKAEKL